MNLFLEIGTYASNEVGNNCKSSRNGRRDSAFEVRPGVPKDFLLKVNLGTFRSSIGTAKPLKSESSNWSIFKELQEGK